MGNSRPGWTFDYKDKATRDVEYVRLTRNILSYLETPVKKTFCQKFWTFMT